MYFTDKTKNPTYVSSTSFNSDINAPRFPLQSTSVWKEIKGVIGDSCPSYTTSSQSDGPNMLRSIDGIELITLVSQESF